MHRFLALFLALLPAAIAGLFSQPELQVITTTDMTEAGRKVQASPEAPVRYVAVDLGYRDLGGIIAGDKLPDRKAVNKTLAKVLEKQGYLQATNKQPPTQLLVWFWGTFYVERLHRGDPTMPDAQINQKGMLRFLGGEKLGMPALGQEDPFSSSGLPPGLQFQNPELDRFLETAKEDLYVIAVGCYDLEIYQKTKKLELLWVTKIAAPSKGFVMKDTLSKMAAIAGPNIGRETSKPVWVDADSHYKPDVQIGEGTVVEENVKADK